MIRLCNNAHLEIVKDYIGNEYYKCLYLYIDMIKYGCSSEFTKTWIQENDGNTTAVMLAYHSALHVYSKDLKFDIRELAEFINCIWSHRKFVVECDSHSSLWCKRSCCWFFGS